MMIRCAVSGCPNREVPGSRALFNRPRKRFFCFPKEPARVKVWLAALRETEQQDPAEQQLICEDHFLPEDISKNGVSADAIPIMPPCLDEPLTGAWGPESSEGEEDPWAGPSAEAAEAEDTLPFHSPERAEPAEPAEPAEAETDSFHVQTDDSQIKTAREDVSLGLLTVRFLDLFFKTPGEALDLRSAITSLNTRRRRIYDITNVLEGIQLLERRSTNKVTWTGPCPISSFLGTSRAWEELDNLKQVEETLDGLIRSCSHQLFQLTDDPLNAALAYVSAQDLQQLQILQDQTVLLVKAPEETRLEVAPPKEDSIQLLLRGGRGPVMVNAFEVGVDSWGRSFTELERSRVTVTRLHRES